MIFKIKNIKIYCFVILWIGVSPLLLASPTLLELYTLRDTDALEQLIEEETPLANTAEKKKRLGIAWHNLAAEEESGAANKAVAILKAVVKELPNDYGVLAYLGSAQTMVGRDSWNPLTKMSNANKGIATIDKAVRKDKDGVTPRLIRLYTSLALPSFLGRQVKVKPDLDYLIDLIQRTEVSSEVHSEINFLMGDFLRKENKQEESAKYLKKAIQVNPDTQWAQQAKDLLDD